MLTCFFRPTQHLASCTGRERRRQKTGGNAREVKEPNCRCVESRRVSGLNESVCCQLQRKDLWQVEALLQRPVRRVEGLMTSHKVIQSVNVPPPPKSPALRPLHDHCLGRSGGTEDRVSSNAGYNLPLQSGCLL